MDIHKFFCEKCNYGTDYKDSMDKHEKSSLHITGERGKRKKTGRKKYVCGICEYENENINNYQVHMLNNHSSKEERMEKFKYYCNICDVGAFAESFYQKHLLTSRHKRLEENNLPKENESKFKKQKEA